MPTTDHPCDGCRFKGSKRCNVCSRHYTDRYEPLPPPKPISKKTAALLSFAQTVKTLGKDYEKNQE